MEDADWRHIGDVARDVLQTVSARIARKGTTGSLGANRLPVAGGAERGSETRSALGGESIETRAKLGIERGAVPEGSRSSLGGGVQEDTPTSPTLAGKLGISAQSFLAASTEQTRTVAAGRGDSGPKLGIGMGRQRVVGACLILAFPAPQGVEMLARAAYFMANLLSDEAEASSSIAARQVAPAGGVLVAANDDPPVLRQVFALAVVVDADKAHADAPT